MPAIGSNKCIRTGFGSPEVRRFFLFFVHICANSGHRALNSKLQIQLTNMTTIATSRTPPSVPSKSLVGPLQPFQPKRMMSINL